MKLSEIILWAIKEIDRLDSQYSIENYMKIINYQYNLRRLLISYYNLNLIDIKTYNFYNKLLSNLLSKRTKERNVKQKTHNQTI